MQGARIYVVIWSGYAGTTINRFFHFCIYSVPEVGMMDIRSLWGIRPPEEGGLAYPCRVPGYMRIYMVWLSRPHDPFATLITRGQSNLTKSPSRGAHSPVRGHRRGSKFVPLNSWGRGFLLVFHSNYRPRMHRLAPVHARDNQRPTTSRHSLPQ